MFGFTCLATGSLKIRVCVIFFSVNNTADDIKLSTGSPSLTMRSRKSIQ